MEKPERPIVKPGYANGCYFTQVTQTREIGHFRKRSFVWSYQFILFKNNISRVELAIYVNRFDKAKKIIVAYNGVKAKLKQW